MPTASSSWQEIRSSASLVTRRLALILLLMAAAGGLAASSGDAAGQAAAVAPVAAAADLKTALTNLSSLDYPVRMNAARTLRRASAADVVPLLADAARTHPDEFVKYRALVLLTAFNDRGTPDLVRSLIADRNDRVREVAYKFLEQHPDPRLTQTLLAALQTEQAEFVRPALIRAVAALGSNPAVQRALLAETGRGLDFFRIAVIDALGVHHAAYAVDALAAVARLDGPLQNEAVLALGRIGDTRAKAALAAITRPPRELVVTIEAAQCLLGDPCEPHIRALSDAAVAPRVTPAVVTGAMAGLSAIAASGNAAAIQSLLDLSSRAAVREAAAVALASAAVRRPEAMILWLDGAPEAARETAIGLLKDGFDRLEEDFAEEQFYATARAAYWAAPDNSSARTLAAALIQRLDF
jgi:HEAT repeat protein